jgi:polar amino acid transport system substrate-binding protein
MKYRFFIIILLIILSSMLTKVFYFNTQVPQKNVTLFVGTNAEFPPFSFYQGGKITGFDIEVMEEIALRLNKKMNIKDLPFETLIPEIQLNKLQILIGGFNPTPERLEQVSFTQPVFDQDQLALFSRADGPKILELSQLENKRVIVNEGYFADAFLSSKPIKMTLIRLSTNSTLEALTALDMKKGDVFVGSIKTVIPFLSAERKQQYQITPLDKASEKDAFVVSKNHPELLAQINETIDTMKKDGSLDILIHKWFTND